MKTPDWRATNAPSGPPMAIRCGECGEKLFALAPSTAVVTAPLGVKRTKTCKCGAVLSIRVVDNENSPSR